MGTQVVSLRLGREGARTSDALQASLVWNDIADLDLSCITPDDERIYYGHKNSECGGWLDVDMNVGAHNASEEPVENIFFASAPSGRFRFIVKNFSTHTRSTNPKYADSGRSVKFRLFLTRNGEVECYDGSLKNHQEVTCFDFENQGRGALGSYVVMPPSETKTTFKESCEKNGVTFEVGNGYYAVARKEEIQPQKKMLLQNIEEDTFTIGGKSCREKLGWPEGRIKKGPKDIPAGLRLFVQSTSHNRVIQPGTHVLMKVSVAEALRHREAASTQFLGETQSIGQK